MSCDWPAARARLRPLPPDPEHGVFETLLVIDGRAQALERHLARLSEAVRELYGAKLEAPRLDLPRGAHRLRIDAIPGADGLEVGVEVTPLDRSPQPVALHPVELPCGLGPYKWRDRRWLDAQTPVALLVDTEGCVLEAAWGNVWALEGSRLVTPPADGRILAGVTRGLLLESGFDVGVEPLTLERLRAADAVFLTSALRHAVPAGIGGAPEGEPPAVGEVRAALAAVAWDDRYNP